MDVRSMTTLSLPPSFLLEVLQPLSYLTERSLLVHGGGRGGGEQTSWELSAFLMGPLNGMRFLGEGLSTQHTF